MRRILSVAAVLIMAGVAAAQDKGPEGTYTVKSASMSGQALPADVLATLSEVRITATEFVIVQASGMEEKAAIKLDAKAGTLDMTGAKPRLGVFKVENGELTVAIGPANGKRPADTKGGDGIKVMVLAKKK
ncbi:MAG: hypothetical protein MUF18_09990 [Fimbriiglobus sp.]|jgi:uncharacterized protein (TIGR03067 family)|nr:hypothetical protein [Fimbriiglobus sp.]